MNIKTKKEIEIDSDELLDKLGLKGCANGFTISSVKGQTTLRFTLIEDD